MGNIWYTCRFLNVSTTIYGSVWPLVYIFHWGTWWLTLLLGVFLPTLGWNAKLFFQQTICHTGIRRRSRPVNDLGTFQASCVSPSWFVSRTTSMFAHFLIDCRPCGFYHHWLHVHLVGCTSKQNLGGHLFYVSSSYLHVGWLTSIL